MGATHSRFRRVIPDTVNGSKRRELTKRIYRGLMDRLPVDGEITVDHVRSVLRTPTDDDDKYSRGVLGVLAGSDRYPGAAVLCVEAASRTGVGMVRYLGPPRAADLVLHRRPEAVTARGRVQAWLIGSGTDPVDRSPGFDALIDAALDSDEPVVLDAGALDRTRARSAATVLTPHGGELARLLSERGERVTRADIALDPERWARRAAELTGSTVLLKGRTTRVVSPVPSTPILRVVSPTTWLATAGSGDVLAGIVGALLAQNSARLARGEGDVSVIAASAAWIHGRAGFRASGHAPLVALDIAQSVPEIIGELLTPSRGSAKE